MNYTILHLLKRIQENMKYLFSIILASFLLGCGGGNTSINTKYIGSIKLLNGSAIINVDGTQNNGPKGYIDINLNTSVDVVTVKTKITFNNFFKENPIAHFALALKADKNTTTAAQGQGVAIGALQGTPQGSSYPFSAHIENWQLDTNEVLRSTEYPVFDNMEYDLEVYANAKDTRYVLSHQGKLLHDTGYVKNNMNNIGSKSNIIFAFVFGNPDSYIGSIDLKDIYITW
jgi:hypothetical protein